ncbi:hypothetical protein BT96DRAFT_963052 [Gymnopus androsaceus JB14]|uniref:Uncharacterized protein n=1 Tax=Gymnopus androsaceus JB14 TaxID=1447944 RepID=A0A6A4IEM2_9AGAR|nr:hypothetical protein BT96DRAFT_963052 [Gymnopus androsaceus JB14]
MKLDWHLWWDLSLTQLCAALRIAYASRIYRIRDACISISMKLGISTKLSSPHSSPQNPVLSDMVSPTLIVEISLTVSNHKVSLFLHTVSFDRR